ncbi:MAG: DASS family sodium-coupled anion symporter [Bacteriovoracaceae bacterium]
MKKYLVILIGLILGFCPYLLNFDKTIQVIGISIWLVLWWSFHIAPLGIVALIPIIIFPSLNLMPLNKVVPAYSNSVIFLFLGGFIISHSLEKSRLSEWLAFKILNKTGNSAEGIVKGFIILCTLMSMWISNTSTTLIVLPMALSIIKFLKENTKIDTTNLSIALMLAIAYTSSIAGAFTPIGTPPNVVYLAMLKQKFDISISFLDWFILVAPPGILLLISLYYVLKIMHPFEYKFDQNFKTFLQEKTKNMGKLNQEQKRVAIVFLLTCILWIFKFPLQKITNCAFFDDSIIAVLGGVLLFFIPTAGFKSPTILNRSDIAKLPWDIVLLFGGGMSLATTMENVGILEKIVEVIKVNQFSLILILFITINISVYLSEVMSNVALCTIFTPFALAIGEKLGGAQHAAIFGAICAVATSFAFALPIGTPPNSIVFSSGHLKSSQMIRVGLILNIIGAILLTVTGYFNMH